MDVTDESGQPQQSQQTEDLSKADDAECPGRLVHLRVDPFLHDEEDIIHRYRRDKVHHKPGLQVLLLNLVGIEDDLCVVLEHNASPEVQHQVHEKEGVRHNIEDDPGCGGLVFKEGDAHGDNDQVAHHEHQHSEVPVEPDGIKQWEETQTMLNFSEI